MSKLKELSLFHGIFSDDEIQELEKHVRMVRVSPSYTLFQKGDIGSDVYIVLRGAVIIYDVKGEVKRVFTRIEKGDLFGEFILINESHKRSAYASTCDEGADLLIISRNVFTEVLEKKPALKERVKDVIIKRLKAQKDLIEEQIARAKKFEVRVGGAGVHEIR
jgi:CRP/FNR family transcriptional regulator, cyclic AMP receptor protein